MPYLLNAQFDQTVSLKLSAGTFKTIGKKLGEYDPMQMPNYGMGFAADGGLQFRLSPRFSLSAEFGVMISQRWSYREGDNNNYLYWEILDTLTEDLIAQGENYLDIYNYSLGLMPVYYMVADGKWKPYMFFGINVNLTNAYFEDTEWMELKKLNRLDPDDTGPYNYNLERNIGIGVIPGLGLEYSPNSKLNFILSSGYDFIFLNKKNFKSPEREENFKAFVIQAGLRMYFIKSKDL